MSGSLLSVRSLFSIGNCVRCNCTRASIGKIKRELFVRTYPTVVVLPDGSTISVRYKEPRQIITFPLDINTLSEDEKRERLAARKVQRKVTYEDDTVDDSFSVKDYEFVWKK